MESASIALVLATLGVSFGWQPTSEGPEGYEYTVQLEPEIADLLRRGETVPIESNVPPEIAPIRKVKIVVGRGDVPRTALSADAAKLKKYVANGVSRIPPAAGTPPSEQLIVRGQSPDDTPITGSSSRNAASAFAGDAPPWSPQRNNQPASSANVDRYGNPITPATTGIGPPPGFAGRVGGAVDETAGALRDGLEAGFAEANEQLSRAGDNLWQRTRGATQNITEQLESAGADLSDATQQVLGTVSKQAQPSARPPGGTSTQPPPAFSDNVANATTRAGATSAPPWPQNQAMSRTLVAGGPITRTPSGWTSIAGNIAAPSVRPPALAASGSGRNSASNRQTRVASNNVNGPSFPGPSPGSRDSLHTTLADPWDDTQASGQTDPERSAPRASAIDRAADSGLVPIRPVRPQVPRQQQAPAGFSDPWDDDRWNQPPQASPLATAGKNSTPPINNQANAWPDGGVANPAANWENPPGSVAPVANGSQLPNNARPADAVTPTTTQRATPVATNSEPPANAPLSSPNAVAGTTSPAASAEMPWRPLLFVSLGLVCSLSANLFLGWSYLDARQRYVALVRKTAQSFRRRASEAA